MNKLYAVQYYSFAENSYTIVGLFRDENTAIKYQNDKNNGLLNKMLLKKSGYSLPEGNYTVNVIYTDF